MSIKKEDYVLHSVRGANTCLDNTSKSIEIAVEELLIELFSRNNLVNNQILSITFSVTKDLDACFPAAIARKKMHLGDVSILDCQQMHVKDDLKRCIRLLAHVWLIKEQIPKHTYLGDALKLRPDR